MRGRLGRELPGIRIEEDYLITERELEWISRAPREIAEVEGEMRHRPLQP